MHHQKVTSPRYQRFTRIVHKRLVAKAVSDIFINSLVLASFCPDHAPKKQSFAIHIVSSNKYCTSTIPPSSRYGGRNITKSTTEPRQLSFTSHVSNIPSKSVHSLAARNDHDDRDMHTFIRSPSTDTDYKPLRAMKQGHTEENKDEHDRSFVLKYILSDGKRKWLRKAKRQGTMVMKMPLINALKLRQERSRTNRETRQIEDGPVAEKRSLNFTIAPDLESFLSALWDYSKSNQYIFKLYKSLPSPGVKLLTAEERGELLYRFSHPPDRRRSNARYYLSIFEDMIESGFKLSRSMCTSAIYFTSHKVPVLERRDLIYAIAIWHRMEKVYGIQSDSAVFELLFRIASNTGHFEVADRLLLEMASRGLQLSREGYVTKIYSHGRKLDISGIHQTFEAYVKLGAIVDTTILNCMISSLLNAGDSDTAEQLYYRMIQDFKRTINITPTERQQSWLIPSWSSEFTLWRPSAKRLGAIFKFYLEMRRRNGVGPWLQDVVPVAPDTRTFHILLRHHCLHSGNMVAIGQLLRDMEQMFPVPPRSIIYYFLFRGFATHSPDKGWTSQRLMEVWGAFKRALYETYMRMESLEAEKTLKPKWENPLESIYTDAASVEEDHPHEIQTQNAGKYQSHESPENSTNDSTTDDDENIMKQFDKVAKFGRLHSTWYPDENLSRKIDHGIFLSRGLNIVILKAFGAHSQTDDLLRVFSEIERMWKPWKRLAVDVQSVKKELHRQLNKVQNRNPEHGKRDTVRYVWG